MRPWTSSDAGWWPGVLPITTFWMNWRTMLMNGCFVSASACSHVIESGVYDQLHGFRTDFLLQLFDLLPEIFLGRCLP